MKICKRQPEFNHFGTHVVRWSLIFFLALAGCTPPAEEASRYYQNGMNLLDQGNPAKAALEFRNALQIVNTMTPATFGLALSAEQREDWPAMMGYLNQVIAAEPDHWQAHLKRGQLLLAGNNAAAALEPSDAAFKLAPKDPAVLALRAGVLFELGRGADAEQAALAALTQEPGHVETLIILANERLGAGRARDAVAYLDQGLEFWPDHIGLTLLKAQSLEQDGEKEAAQMLLEELVAAHPEVGALNLTLARFHTRSGNFAEAEQTLEALANKGPGNLEAKLELVQLVGRTRGPAAATAALKSFTENYPGSPELQFALVELLRGTGKEQEADAVLQRMVHEHGDSQQGLRAKEALATSHYTQGLKADAMVLVDQVLETDPRSEQGLFLRATIAVEQRKLERAIADLRLLLSEKPSTDRALLLLAVAYRLSGASELAGDQYQRAFLANPTVRYGIAFANYLIGNGDYIRAEQVLERSLLASPENEELLVKLAQVRLDRSDWQGAEAIAQVLQENGARAMLYEQVRGAISAHRNDYPEAIAAYRRAYEGSPGHPQILRALVQVFVAAGQREAAVSLLESTVERESHGVAAYLLLGEVFSSAGADQKAIRAFEAAIRKDAASPSGYLGLARLHLQENRVAEAEKTIDAGIAIDQGDTRLGLAKAEILQRKGEIDAAIDHYEGLLQENPSSDVIANNLASLLTERNDKESLERAYQLALRFERSNVAHFKDTLGWASYRLGRYPQAVALLQDAIARQPELPVLHYHLGMSYLAMNNPDDARWSLEKALELSSQTDFPHRALARDALLQVTTSSAENN